jgi:hypothetical protein
MRADPTVNIYCADCHVGSPRQLRELVHASPYCTVCGAALIKSFVKIAMTRLIEAGATRDVDGVSVNARSVPKKLSQNFEA